MSLQRTSGRTRRPSSRLLEGRGLSVEDIYSCSKASTALNPAKRPAAPKPRKSKQCCPARRRKDNPGVGSKRKRSKPSVAKSAGRSKTQGRRKRRRKRRATPKTPKPAPLGSLAYFTELCGSPRWPKGTPQVVKDKHWLEKHKIELLEPYSAPVSREVWNGSVFELGGRDTAGPKTEDINTPLEAATSLLDEFWSLLYERTLAELTQQEAEGRKNAFLKARNYSRAKFDRWLAVLIILGVTKATSVKAAFTKSDARYLKHVTKLGIGINPWKTINALVTTVMHTDHSFYALYNALVDACTSKWVPSEVVSVDESLIKFFGWFRHHFGLKRKAAKNGVKLFGLVDSLGWFFAWSLSKRKTMDGKRLPPVAVQDTVYSLLQQMPKTKTYHVFVDAWFTNEALTTGLASRGLEVTGSVSSDKFAPLWRILDKDFAERRTEDHAHKFSVARGVLIKTGKPFWAVLCRNPRKGVNARQLHYVSTHIDGQQAVRAMKTDMTAEYRRVRQERVLSGIKDVYDQNFSNEDKDDQSAAEVTPIIRSGSWERATLQGLMFLLLASNVRILFDYHAKEVAGCPTKLFVQEIAYGLAGYDPLREHTRVPWTRNACAVCKWWKKNRARAGFRINRTETGCDYCQVRVCSDCWKYRHAQHAFALKK